MQSQVETLEGRRVVSGVPGFTAPSFQGFFFFFFFAATSRVGRFSSVLEIGEIAGGIFLSTFFL